jgi:hypothetical protein
MWFTEWDTEHAASLIDGAASRALSQDAMRVDVTRRLAAAPRRQTRRLMSRAAVPYEQVTGGAPVVDSRTDCAGLHTPQRARDCAATLGDARVRQGFAQRIGPECS